MNLFLIFTALLWLTESSQVHSAGLLGWIFGTQAPAPEQSSLVLAVETSGRVYLANNEFVKNQMNAIYSKFLFACPFEPGSAMEEVYGEESTTKNALFIEKTYEKPKSPEKNIEFIEHKCKNPVKPSIIHVGSYEGDLDWYLVGYEVFLDEDIKSYQIDDFDSASLKDERFAWFNLYTISFDREHGNVLNVFSPMLAYKNAYQSETISATGTSKAAPNSQLDSYLGKELFYKEDFNIVKYYGKENQEEVFQNLFVDWTLMRYVDPAQNRHLGDVHLAAVNTFGISVMKQAALTFGNIAPMWNIVYKYAWSNLEKQIEYIAKGLNAIHVITGTYETLNLYGEEINLGPNKSVRVPAAFFKIVSYSPNFKEKYNMLVVTSNNPYDKNDQINSRLCEKNQCAEFGWEYVQQDYFALGRTSCCKLTKQNLRELKMDYMEPLIDKTLDLTKVPHWKVKNLTLNLKTYMLGQKIKVTHSRADDFGYYNSEQPVEFDRDDDEVTFSKLVSVMYNNYVQPYFSD